MKNFMSNGFYLTVKRGEIIERLIAQNKKVASYLYRAAQPPILAAFLPWGGSAGAGRIRLAGAKVPIISGNEKFNQEYMVLKCPAIV